MKRAKFPAVLEVVGYSGAGKTTLIEKLIPALRKRGIRLAVIKHTSHHHELDKPGKDSHRLRRAGAEAVMVSSPKDAVSITICWRWSAMIPARSRRRDLSATRCAR